MTTTNQLSSTNTGQQEPPIIPDNNTSNIQPEPQYPTADVLLSMIQKEYDIEASRKRDIEARTGILIALLGALIGFYTSAIDFSIFKKAHSTIEYLCFTFIGIIYIFPLITFFLSMKDFINVLQTKKYQRIGLGGITKNVAQKPKDVISMQLAESYKTVVEDNGKSNEEKAIQFKKGISLMYISLIGIIIAYIIKQIVSLII
ncbi:hypothetical protein OCF13_11915 [Bacillus tropicus]|uniref:hypothetical protein n=1 Tax=Bacillus cereus group TaxID=86661 RepID=UPI000BF20A33|nr:MULTISPECIES: hypothetical protein [Bacillus cereus group]MCC2339468.1 hypothetical protein [Bacillus tropicus]MCU5422712.1 hypothetical protein [Bacillus tropicus]PEJ38191.1 hypothetical protein CN889_21255 [Bacillus wiedmannii]